jgi:hypothetical protein
MQKKAFMRYTPGPRDAPSQAVGKLAVVLNAHRVPRKHGAIQ